MLKKWEELGWKVHVKKNGKNSAGKCMLKKTGRTRLESAC
jgi:hypothetical protein